MSRGIGSDSLYSVTIAAQSLAPTERTPLFLIRSEFRPAQAFAFLLKMPKGGTCTVIFQRVYASPTFNGQRPRRLCEHDDNVASLPPCTRVSFQPQTPFPISVLFQQISTPGHAQELAVVGESGHDQFLNTFGKSASLRTTKMQHARLSSPELPTGTCCIWN